MPDATGVRVHSMPSAGVVVVLKGDPGVHLKGPSSATLLPVRPSYRYAAPTPSSTPFLRAPLPRSPGRPEDLVVTHIAVPPVAIRPSVEMDGASNEDDITMKLMVRVGRVCVSGVGVG